MKKRTFYALMATVAAVFMLTGCNSEKKYTINGNVPKLVDAEWIYLYTIKDGEPIAFDSSRIENHTFCFKGTVPDTISFVVLHPGSFEEYPTVGWNVVLEEGQIVVDSSEQFVSGTPLNDGFKDWMGSLYNIMMKGNPEEIKNFFAEHWSEHSGDFIGSFVLYNFSPYMDFPFVDSLAADVPDEVRQVSMLKPFFEQLEKVRAMQPGNMFTDVELKYIDGTDVKLSDIIGKGDWVLIDFWASWCGPCRQAMPELQTIAKKFKELKVYGIAVSDEAEDTRQAIANLKITWPVISDQPGLSAQTYGISAIPAMILFEPDGKIAARDFTLSSLDSMLTDKMVK